VTQKVISVIFHLRRKYNVAINFLRKLDFVEDGVSFDNFSDLQDPAFQSKHREVYGQFKPGKNAANKLCRGVRWGTMCRGKIQWLDRSSYSLSAGHNPEESGNVRHFDLIPTDYLDLPQVQTVLMQLFMTLMDKCSFQNLIEVQLSAIRYEPTLEAIALPSPVIPHQDTVDGAIVVMSKSEGIVGGVTRLYSLDDMPLYEVDLQVGEALVLNDSRYKHQVTPMMVDIGAWRHERVFRDVLLVRFQDVGR